MNNSVQQLQKQLQADLGTVTSVEQLNQLREQYYSRKHGQLTKLLKSVSAITNVIERKQYGSEVNILKQTIQQLFDAKAAELSTQHHSSHFDPTLPAAPLPHGRLHPLRQVEQDLIDVFHGMGFMIAEGNELENELYCFEYLNIPATHPARDLQDTFYIETTDPIKQVLRTHTSNMQVRLMQQYQPPLRAVVPGRVFRNEAIDASHEHTFYQMEGFVVDEHISIAHLVYVLKTAMSKILRQDVKIRLRPGYFPYVEPGFEADCSCTNCGGKGCSVCKHSGWVEMLGCGMIHPKVFESAGYPAGKYSGFAFGIGLNRLAMMRYHLNNIRWFMSGDIRFLEQF